MDKSNSIPDHSVSGILPIDVGEQKNIHQSRIPGHADLPTEYIHHPVGKQFTEVF